MSSNLKVNTVLPSVGTAIGIGTAGGSVSITSNTITALTGGSERLRINSDGKVGLGTTGSDYALSIREADNNNKWLMLQKNSGQEILQIREDGDNHAIIDGSHASGELHFYTAGVERLRLNTSGRLGLNTDSPDMTFTIKSGGDAQMSLKNTSGTTKAYFGTAGAFGSAGTDDLRIRSDSSNIVFGFSGVEKFRMTSTGNVGIGTAVPQVTLDIGGVSAVGISSLQNPMLYAGLSQANANGWGGVVLGAGLNGNSPTIAASKNASGAALPLVFQTDATSRMTITASGTVTKAQQPYVFINGITNTGGSGYANNGTATTYGDIVYSAGKVTAQVEGNYMICFNTISDNGTGRIDAYIRVNGSVKVNLLTSNNGTGYRQKNGSIVYHLNANDYVEFENEDWYNATSTTTEWRTASVYMLG